METPAQPQTLPNGVLCPKCGYDMGGLAVGVCPECGLSSEQVRRAREAARKHYDSITRRRSSALIILCAMIGVAAVVLAMDPAAFVWVGGCLLALVFLCMGVGKLVSRAFGGDRGLVWFAWERRSWMLHLPWLASPLFVPLFLAIASTTGNTYPITGWGPTIFGVWSLMYAGVLAVLGWLMYRDLCRVWVTVTVWRAFAVVVAVIPVGIGALVTAAMGGLIAFGVADLFYPTEWPPR